MDENQDELFNRDNFIKKEYKADYVFSKSYKKMTREVERVANEKVTLWSRLVTWIYEKIHDDRSLTKSKQNNKQKYQSAKGFRRVVEIFKPYNENSMTNEEIFKTTRSKFDKK